DHVRGAVSDREQQTAKRSTQRRRRCHRGAGTSLREWGCGCCTARGRTHRGCGQLHRAAAGGCSSAVPSDLVTAWPSIDTTPEKNLTLPAMLDGSAHSPPYCSVRYSGRRGRAATKVGFRSLAWGSSRPSSVSREICSFQGAWVGSAGATASRR